MKNLIIVFVAIAFPLCLSAQFDKEVLRNAPTSITCDSNKSMYIEVEFYHNMMPMANPSILHGSITIGDRLEPFTCKNLVFQKLFYFYGEELIIQPLKTYPPWKKGSHTGVAPDIIIAEFIDEQTGKYVYLKKEGPFPIGEVQ